MAISDAIRTCPSFFSVQCSQQTKYRPLLNPLFLWFCFVFHIAITTLQFLDGMLGLCAVVHFARPDRSSEAKRGDSPSNAGGGTAAAEPVSLLISRANHYLPKIQAVSSWGKKQAGASTTVVVQVVPRSGSVAGNVVVPTEASSP